MICLVTIKFKIKLSKVIKLDVGWDEPLDGEVQEEWRLLLKEVVQYPKFVLPRSAKPIDSIGDPDLIAFCRMHIPEMETWAWEPIPSLTP